jgi:hypothetical protein
MAVWGTFCAVNCEAMASRMGSRSAGIHPPGWAFRTAVTEAVVSSFASSRRSARGEESAGKDCFTASSAWLIVSAVAGGVPGLDAGGADAGLGAEAGGGSDGMRDHSNLFKERQDDVVVPLAWRSDARTIAGDPSPTAAAATNASIRSSVLANLVARCSATGSRRQSGRFAATGAVAAVAGAEWACARLCGTRAIAASIPPPSSWTTAVGTPFRSDCTAGRRTPPSL